MIGRGRITEIHAKTTARGALLLHPISAFRDLLSSPIYQLLSLSHVVLLMWLPAGGGRTRTQAAEAARAALTRTQSGARRSRVRKILNPMPCLIKNL